MRIGWAIVGTWFALLARSPQCRADDAEFFEKRVRPVLVEHCYPCHSASATKLKAGLRLDSRAGMLAGGDSGPAIIPGKPAESRLVRAIRYDDVDLRMPPKGKLPAEAVAGLTEWIKSGAAWPNEAANQKTVSTFDLQKRKAEHWAWQPVRKNEPPAVRNASWVASPIDRFILAKLETQNLSPAPPAKPHDLLRRVYFDLIGLPPPAWLAYLLPIRRRSHMNKSSIVCSRRRNLASAGRGTGSTWSVTRKRAATSSIITIRMRGSTAIT
jgi:hypothetical protein